MKTLKHTCLFLLIPLLAALYAPSLAAQATGNGTTNSKGFQNFNCDSFCVVSIVFDTTSHDSLYVTIANNDTNFINYPIVQLIDTAGDTVANAQGYYYSFGQ